MATPTIDRSCIRCGATLIPTNNFCVNCGAAVGTGTTPLRLTEVVVTDIHMSFGSMVEFMLKWAFASIPAFIIIFLILIIVVYIATSLGVLGSLGAS